MTNDSLIDLIEDILIGVDVGTKPRRLEIANKIVAIIRQHEAESAMYKESYSDLVNGRTSEISVMDAIAEAVRTTLRPINNSADKIESYVEMYNAGVQDLCHAITFRLERPYLATREPVEGKQVMGGQHTEPKGDEGKRNECDCLRRPDSEGIPADKTASPTNHQPDDCRVAFGKWMDSLLGKPDDCDDLWFAWRSAWEAARKPEQEAQQPIKRLDIQTRINLWSIRPQPGTPMGEAWEQGCKQGYEWGLKSFREGAVKQPICKPTERAK